jgi:hypothetical protein
MGLNKEIPTRDASRRGTTERNAGAGSNARVY